MIAGVMSHVVRIEEFKKASIAKSKVSLPAMAAMFRFIGGWSAAYLNGP